MNAAERALSTFRVPPCRYNCAQTVCAALGRTDLLESLVNCGVGNAPGGLCGALYGALQCVPISERDNLKRRFIAHLGYERCHDLKRLAHIPCPICVATAASLVAGEPLPPVSPSSPSAASA